MPYSLTGGQCAADVAVTALGVAWWRARLDVTDAELVVGPTTSLTARMSARARFASIPLTRRRFLREVPDEDTLTLLVVDLPDLSAGAVLADGIVTTSHRTWTVRLAIRLVTKVTEEDERVVLAVAGTVVRDEAAPLVVPLVGFDVAAELVRCD